MQQNVTGITDDKNFEVAMADKENKISQGIRIDRFLASVQNSGYRMAHLATSNTDDALDLVQDAMMQLVKHYGDRPDNELRLLFYKILSSRITDWYRKTAFRQKFHVFFSHEKYQQGDPIQQLEDDLELPFSDKLENQRMIGELSSALKQLSKRQHQAFLLRAWQGFNIKETATIMGCSTGSVKTHYSRALQSLKNLLGDRYER